MVGVEHQGNLAPCKKKYVYGNEPFIEKIVYYLIMQEPKDKFSSLMQKSKLMLPFSDFEDNTMKRIEADLKYKSSIKRSFQISAVFFVLGTGFGLIANSVLSNAQGSIMGLSSDKLLLAFQLVFVVIVLVQSENIFRLFTKLKQ